LWGFSHFVRSRAPNLVPNLVPHQRRAELLPALRLQGSSSSQREGTAPSRSLGVPCKGSRRNPSRAAGSAPPRSAAAEAARKDVEPTRRPLVVVTASPAGNLGELAERVGSNEWINAASRRRESRAGARHCTWSHGK